MTTPTHYDIFKRPDRIHKPGCSADTFIAREMIEREAKAIPRDVQLGWFTGPDFKYFELNPELFPQTHRKVVYRREAYGSDWFVRCEGEDA